MADLQGCSSSVHRSEAPRSEDNKPKNKPAEDEFILRWDNDIKRAATSAARRWRLDEEPTDDLVQEARLAILLAMRRGRPTTEPYVRRVIANAVRKAVRREAKAFSQLSADDAAAADPWAEATESPLDFDLPFVDVVAQWVHGLPPRLHAIYKLIYIDEASQRKAAAMLRISQPRVAQLHHQLLEQGRVELSAALVS